MEYSRIKTLNLEDNLNSIKEMYHSFMKEMDDKYNDVTIHEHPVHLAARKRITQQCPNLEFILLYESSEEDAKKVAKIFASKIGIPNFIQIYNRHSFTQMRRIITTLIDWNERPNLVKIIDAINDGYEELFYLYEFTSKDNVHPENSNILGHILYGKIGRKEYHSMLEQGSRKVYVDLKTF